MSEIDPGVDEYQYVELAIPKTFTKITCKDFGLMDGGTVEISHRAFIGSLVVLSFSFPLNVQASSSAYVTLPIIVHDANAANSALTTVTAKTLFGAQLAYVKASATLSSSLTIQQKKSAITISPTDLFLEYTGHMKHGVFSIFCTARPAKPVTSLVCLADRDKDGAFEQFWIGSAANPNLWVPFPDISFQGNINPTAYTLKNAAQLDALTIGFVGFGGNIWTGQREFFIQLEKGNDHVLLFGSRATGSTKNGPVDVNLLNASIRLESSTKDQFELSVTRGLKSGKYELSTGNSPQPMWVYVP